MNGPRRNETAEPDTTGPDAREARDGAGGVLTIGAFAARTRLSPKALRLYDRMGLLSPVRVDEASGYRYYSPDQVERARMVALLRRLDMPLARIAEVVALGGEPAARAVTVFWAEVEARVAAQRGLVDYLRARLTGRSAELYGHHQVRIARIPPQFVISQTRHTLVAGLPAWIGASTDRLLAGAARCGGAAGAPYVVFHAEVTEESDGPVETCVPVVNPVAARAWVLSQGRAWATRAREEPARLLAYLRITKAQVAYPQIIGAYEAVEEWIAGQGLGIAGPPREVYFAPENWEQVGPHTEVCDVAFPVTGG